MKNATYAPPTGRLRRLFTTTLALAVFVGTMAVTTRPAHAASYVSGCFRSADGGIFNGSQVQLWGLVNNQWFYVATTTLGSTPFGNSCAGFPIPTGFGRTVRYKLVVNFRVGTTHFYGRSPLEALPGNLTAHLGTGLVNVY